MNKWAYVSAVVKETSNYGWMLISENFFPKESKDDSDTARYCSGFIVSYLEFPVMCKSQLQTKIYLIYTENEFTSFSQAQHNTLDIIKILKVIESLWYHVGIV